MDQREFDALNPELYREARGAILGDDPPAPEKSERAPEPEKAVEVDKSSTLPDNDGEQQPAADSEEHASPAESDTPVTPGPEHPDPGPPARTRFAGREFENLEQAESSYKEQQARATRAEQRVAEMERAQAQQAANKVYFADLDTLSQDEYARLEQEAAENDLDVRTYRGMVRRELKKAAAEAEQRATADQDYLASVTETHITSHPQFEVDRVALAKALEADPYLLMTPTGLTLQEQERLIRSRLDGVFHAAAKARIEGTYQKRDEAIKASAITEHEKKLAVAKGSASTEAGSSKAAAPSPKPAAPGDAGDELLDLYRKRREKHSLR